MKAYNSNGFITCIKEDLKRFKYLKSNGKYLGAWTNKDWLSIFSVRFIPVFIFRMSHYLYLNNLIVFAKFFSLLNFIFFGLEISLNCVIGSGLFFAHTQGTVIGARQIGKNAIIYQGVTIGSKELNFDNDLEKRATIGDDVTIGAGSKILGGINIGNKVIVGANAVVLTSVPEGKMVAGVPAKVIR